MQSVEGSNYASKSGGRLYLQLNDSDFQIESTIISNNKAQDGGGIYFNSEGIYFFIILLNHFYYLIQRNNLEIILLNLLIIYHCLSTKWKCKLLNKKLINSLIIIQRLNPIQSLNKE
ncbi:unnamed protein product [Paramecium sonneborni]|uniref:Uncharacterized protein n=1 Tax=Paramecium sonneborni TaxID=65129 RepID=A0A8S1R4J3_9CILI|nr:unnamed protein product [Paramecium sonneborni]